MIIKNFNLFTEEVRLSDIAKLKGFDDNKIDDWGFNKSFDLQQKLVKVITPNIRFDGHKIRLRITYYDDAIHNIRWKILKRTSLGSIEEFNKVLKDVITKLLETTTNFIYDKKYAIYLKEYNFSIIFKIDLEMLEFNLYTILPGRGVAKVQDIFVL
jgi:hypothetical protein